MWRVHTFDFTLNHLGFRVPLFALALLAVCMDCYEWSLVARKSGSWPPIKRVWPAGVWPKNAGGILFHIFLF